MAALDPRVRGGERVTEALRELRFYAGNFGDLPMDGLHNVLRSIRGESKSRRDHLDVFREFLDHLDRASRRRAAVRAPKSVKGRRRAKL